MKSAPILRRMMNGSQRLHLRLNPGGIGPYGTYGYEGRGSGDGAAHRNVYAVSHERVCHFEGGASPLSRTADRRAPTEKSTVGHGQARHGARFRRPPVHGCGPVNPAFPCPGVDFSVAPKCRARAELRAALPRNDSSVPFTAECEPDVRHSWWPSSPACMARKPSCSRIICRNGCHSSRMEVSTASAEGSVKTSRRGESQMG
jgi:hypothetical protein